MAIDLSHLPESEQKKLIDQAKRDQMNAELGGDNFPLDHFIQALKSRGYTSPERGVPAGRFSVKHPVAEHYAKDGNIEFYNPVKGGKETRPTSDLEGIPLAIGTQSGKPGIEMTGARFPGYTPEYYQTFLDRKDTARRQKADYEASQLKAKQDAEQRAADIEAQRQAAIQQQKYDDLTKRIEFEKTNPLTERRQSASGRMFEAISPGQQYVVPEGVKPNTESWLTEGKFVRDPFVSPEQYSTMTGGAEQRILGKGKAPKSKGVLGEEEKETLGTPTILGV